VTGITSPGAGFAATVRDQASPPWLPLACARGGDAATLAGEGARLWVGGER